MGKLGSDFTLFSSYQEQTQASPAWQTGDESETQRWRWQWWQPWWWWLGVSYVKAVTTLTTSANICHFQHSQILDLMCLNWFSSAWHCLSDCHSPPWLTSTVPLARRPANITGRRGRWRRMDWSRKSSGRWPLCDLFHDTISPKWQKWLRIMCFKVKHGRDKTQQAPPTMNAWKSH